VRVDLNPSAAETAGPDLVRLYLNEIGRYPLLTKAQEVSLAQAIETGRDARERLANGTLHEGTARSERAAAEELAERGEQAATAFVQANLRLVVSIARRYLASDSALMDLVQDGNLGLMHAVEKFDWRRGFKFSTYATWWIRQAIARGTSNTSRSIRLPIHAADVVANAYRVRYETFQRNGHSATNAEIARELEVSETYLSALLAAAGSTRSLSETFGERDGLELSDRLVDTAAISPLQAAVDTALAGELDVLLDCLDERERRVLQLRYGLDRGEPRTLDEVGAEFQLTRERIRQIEQRALIKLRHPVTADRARRLLEG
jgi:RNA polymerase sigma factor (sigma-70 family)